jgi:hypothetical protein
VKRLAACMVFAAAGCGSPTQPPPAPDTPGDHGHAHERGKMMIADAGKYHALLTAHLSKAGHELDLFFETADDKAAPVAIPIESFVAEVQIRAGEGELKQVEFRPAPADERPPGEGPGRCSHFVARVPWLNPNVPHRVTVELTLDGQKVTARWNDFIPRKYAHHED